MINKVTSFWSSRSATQRYIYLAILAFISALLCSPSHWANTGKPEEPLSTKIPSNHSLVTVKIVNYESLDSVLGPYGVVDLYSVNKKGTPGKTPVVRSIRIIRAPRNPDHFAVLSPMSGVKTLLENGPLYHAVVGRLDQEGTKFEEREDGKIKIIVEDQK